MTEVILPQGPATEHQLASLEGELQASGLPRNAFTPVLAASELVKAGPGTLYGFTVYSSNAGTQYIQLFDARTLPADGAVPLLNFPVTTKTTLGVDWGTTGRWFERGIFICNSSTDTTKTIGSADCLFDVQYI